MSGFRLRIAPGRDCDIAIVGAGPAGAAAAIHLARAGAKPVLVDAHSFPRDKVCGDFVGPVALRELHALGVAARPEYAASNVIHGAAVFLDGKELIASQMPHFPGLPSHGRVVPRLALDQWLYEAARGAGVPVLERHRARDFSVDPDGVTLALDGPEGPRTLRARALIGADGSASTVARKLRGRGASDRSRIVAVRAYYEGVAGPSDRCDLFFTGSSFPGYGWLFPTGPGTANVGVGMLLDTLPPSDEHLRELLLRLVAEDAALGARLAQARLAGKVVGWPLATYDPGDAMAGERVLLAGDAAGLINPLNGEGIQYALLSGRWAAEALSACLAADDFSAAALSRYVARVKRELDYDMALARIVVQLIRNRSLNAVWLQALRVIVARARIDPVYADITGGVLAGMVPAASVLSPHVIASTVKQAAFSAAFASIKHAIRGPRHLAHLGVDALDFGVSAATAAATSPEEFLRWGAGVATSGAALATQFATHAAQALLRREGQQPTLAAPAPGLTLRLPVSG
jgi:geranylgeranyl reductase family protein